MSSRRCILLGGGPIDGFHVIPDETDIWVCVNLNEPRMWEQCDPSSVLNIKQHHYHRGGRHLFVHESEYTREAVYV